MKVKIDLTSEMIMNKMLSIVQYVSDISPNITLLSEMWKTSSLPGKYDCFSAAVKDFVATESFSIDCFSTPLPTGERGGGVATLSKAGLNVKRYSFRSDYVSFESLFVIVNYNKRHVLLGNIYRLLTSPNAPF